MKTVQKQHVIVFNMQNGETVYCKDYVDDSVIIMSEDCQSFQLPNERNMPYDGAIKTEGRTHEQIKKEIEDHNATVRQIENERQSNAAIRGLLNNRKEKTTFRFYGDFTIEVETGNGIDPLALIAPLAAFAVSKKYAEEKEESTLTTQK
jgi:hypothetical protein